MGSRREPILTPAPRDIARVAPMIDKAKKLRRSDANRFLPDLLIEAADGDIHNAIILGFLLGAMSDQ